MSYILDALKKSEQDRALQDSDADSLLESKSEPKPELNPVDTLNHATSMYAPLPSMAVMAGVVALLAALVASFIMFWDHGADSLPELENALIVTSNVSEMDESDPITGAVTIDPISEPLAVIDQSTLELEHEPLPIEQLPSELASKLSPMTISSHIYSTEANRRSIVVNNQRLVEGDYVFTDVKIKQITHQGMIVVVQGRSFIVNRSRGWGL